MREGRAGGAWLALLPLWTALAACGPAANGADMTDRRLTPETPINQSGPLAIPLFDMPAGSWTLTGPQGACPIALEPSAVSTGGAVIWPDCAALPFSAARWTLDAAGLVLWSGAGARVATFRTDMLPPLSGESANGERLTLSRR